MRIHRLEVLTHDLASQRVFYGDVLGLPVLNASDDLLEVLAGTSRLVFRLVSPQQAGSHHFAFNIPRNLFHPAKEWLARRAPLVKDHQGRDEFFFEDWNAEAAYFYDPAGNVLEFIARRSLSHEATSPFASQHILCISEIGVAVPDVRATAALIQERTGIGPYRPPTDAFAPIGTAEGLIILVMRGRDWFPDTGIQAAPLPLTAILSGDSGPEFSLISAPEGVRIA